MYLQDSKFFNNFKIIKQPVNISRGKLSPQVAVFLIVKDEQSIIKCNLSLKLYGI